MKTDSKQAERTFAFMTVLEDPAAGMVGGLLVVNGRGRPVEFHCTASIAPSRAEEILFGPTLRPHFYCERIGSALIGRLSAAPSLLVIHQVECWPIAEDTESNVVLVDPQAAADPQGGNASNRAAIACLDRIAPATRDEVQALLDELVRYIDLAEPFERVKLAIREAGLLGSHADNQNDGEAVHDVAA